MGFLKVQCLVGVSHEIGRGAQGASHVAPGKSGVHAHGEGQRVIALVFSVFLRLWHLGA